MSKQPRQQPDRDDLPPVLPATPEFTLVPLRERHDGWTAHRQLGFVQALAETGCVAEACRHVGMSPRSAYSLRDRADALSFRQAWDIALDSALARIGEAAIGRALHGVAHPIFYKGEQVGERRVFNERLTTFILSRGAPDRWGAWRDGQVCQRANPDGANALLTEAMRRVIEDAVAMQTGQPIQPRLPLPSGVRVVAQDDEEDLPNTLALRDMEIKMLRGEIARMEGRNADLNGNGS